MQSLSEEWTKRHPQGGRSMMYFPKYKAEETKKTMMAEVCYVAGLRFPPGIYNHNGHKCTNFVLQSVMC